MNNITIQDMVIKRIIMKAESLDVVLPDRWLIIDAEEVYNDDQLVGMIVEYEEDILLVRKYEYLTIKDQKPSKAVNMLFDLFIVVESDLDELVKLIANEWDYAKRNIPDFITKQWLYKMDSVDEVKRC